MKTLVFLAALLVAASLPAVRAGAGSLDGKTFQGQIKEMGKAEAETDTFVFTGGTFRSTACDAYGFGAGSYTATQHGDVWTFTAETHSPTWGTMTWVGTVKGKIIDGSVTRSKDGKTDREQVFLGSLKP